MGWQNFGPGLISLNPRLILIVSATVTFLKINSKEAAKVLAKQAKRKHGNPAEILSESPEGKSTHKKMKTDDQDSGPRTRSKLQ